MAYNTFLFDLDDTLYSRNSGLWPELKKRIGGYLTECMGIPADEVPAIRQRLMSTYGTTLRGLKAENDIDEHHFLQYVHDVDLARYIQPDPELAELLRSYPQQKIIFTSADRKHADRVIATLGLEGIFDQIIDVLDIWPHCKPQRIAFAAALQLAGKQASDCIFVDDIPANVLSARDCGLFPIFIGDETPGDVIRHIPSLHQLPSVISRSGEIVPEA